MHENVLVQAPCDCFEGSIVLVVRRQGQSFRCASQAATDCDQLGATDGSGRDADARRSLCPVGLRQTSARRKERGDEAVDMLIVDSMGRRVRLLHRRSQSGAVVQGDGDTIRRSPRSHGFDMLTDQDNDPTGTRFRTRSKFVYPSFNGDVARIVRSRPVEPRRSRCRMIGETTRSFCSWPASPAQHFMARHERDSY